MRLGDAIERYLVDLGDVELDRAEHCGGDGGWRNRDIDLTEKPEREFFPQ